MVPGSCQAIPLFKLWYNICMGMLFADVEE